MMTKAERADIKKLVAETHPDTGIVILRKPGVRLFTRKSSGPEPRFATVLFLDVEPTAWWPRRRHERPHPIHRAP